MLNYLLKLSLHADVFSVQCAQYPSLIGYGKDRYDALFAFIDKLHSEINAKISKGELIPSDTKMPKTKKDGDIVLTMNIGEELTIALHNTMIDKNLSNTDLARLLALTENEVSDGDWHLPRLLKLKPASQPKYKKVQRLLDIRHDSTLNEIKEAFRVLDCELHVSVHNRTRG